MVTRSPNTLAWKLTVLVMAGALLPVFVVLVSQEGDTSWPLVVIALSASAIALAVVAGTIIVVTSASLRSLKIGHGIADAAAVAARCDNLVDGLDRMLPIIASVASATRVTAYRISQSHEPLVLGVWPQAAEPSLPPANSTIADAKSNGGLVFGAAQSVLVSTRDDGDDIAVEFDCDVHESGLANRVLGDRFSVRSDLERMAVQLEVLVSRAQFVERLDGLSRTDELTWLPNRQALIERLEAERKISQRRKEPLTVVVIDIDDFKSYNDTYGHEAGEALLRDFAATLRARLRATDFVARYGDDEFAMSLPSTDADRAINVITEIHDRARSLDEPVTFSSGLATWNANESIDVLLQRADTALYAAKAAGKDRTLIARPESVTNQSKK